MSDPFKKTGGLLIGGGLSGLYSLVLYLARAHGKGNNRVARQALGLNAALTGGVFIAALTTVLTMTFNESEKVLWPASITFIYFLGNIACTFPLLSETESSDDTVVQLDEGAIAQIDEGDSDD
jgi:hypothetical protein